MSRIKDILKFAESFAPLCKAADFDNVGLLVGDGEAEVCRVLLALDITSAVVEEAEKKGAQLIVSHHPVIFNPLKSLDAKSIPYKLAKAGIGALCLHTNLDVAKDTGVNLCLAEKLGLKELRFYDGEFLVTATFDTVITAEDFAKKAKQALNAQYVTCTLKDKPVKTVGICSGAGGSELLLAKEKGADVFLTGEAHHHNYLESLENDISLVVAGHFETENVVIKPLQKKLAEEFSDVDFIISEALATPLEFI